MFKKLVVFSVLGCMLSMGAVTVRAEQAQEQRGGAMGFVAGCLFGLRAAAAYNEGKEIHWREWARALFSPFAIWDGIDGAKGVTSSSLAEMYGAQFY